LIFEKVIAKRDCWGSCMNLEKQSSNKTSHKQIVISSTIIKRDYYIFHQ